MTGLVVRVVAPVAVVALAACNQVFGLDKVKLQDGPKPFFDAPTDAAFACPGPGEALRFSPLLRQVIAEPCVHYDQSASAGVAMALCNDPFDAMLHVARGAVDQPLDLLYSFDEAGVDIQFLHLTPEGDEVWLTYYDGSYHVRRYDLDSTGSWTRVGDFATSPGYIAMSAPTRSPMRHVIQVGVTDTDLHELVEQANGSYAETQRYSSADLGVFPVTPQLSSDGLRLVFVGTPSGQPTQHLWYAARTSIDSRFTAATLIDGVPVTENEHYYLNDDCSRIYFDGLQQIMYVRQQ